MARSLKGFSTKVSLPATTQPTNTPALDLFPTKPQPPLPAPVEAPMPVPGPVEDFHAPSPSIAAKAPAEPQDAPPAEIRPEVAEVAPEALETPVMRSGGVTHDRARQALRLAALAEAMGKRLADRACPVCRDLEGRCSCQEDERTFVRRGLRASGQSGGVPRCPDEKCGAPLSSINLARDGTGRGRNLARYDTFWVCAECQGGALAAILQATRGGA